MVSARWKSRIWRRKFVREIGSIVLGVLIALGLGAVASEIGWKIEVANAREALASEIGEIAGQARQRERADSCIEARLDAIGAILDEAEKTGRLPPVGALGVPLLRTWSTDVWDTTRSAAIASHMPRHELDDLSGVYSLVAVIQAATLEERSAWHQLDGIVGPGRSLSPDELRDLRAALIEARIGNRTVGGAGVAFDKFVAALHLPVDQADVTKYAAADISAQCQPIPPWNGEHYGWAPGRGNAADVRRNTLPT